SETCVVEAHGLRFALQVPAESAASSKAKTEVLETARSGDLICVPPIRNRSLLRLPLVSRDEKIRSWRRRDRGSPSGLPGAAPSGSSLQARYAAATIEICSSVGHRPLPSACLFPDAICWMVVRAGGVLPKYSA